VCVRLLALSYHVTKARRWLPVPAGRVSMTSFRVHCRSMPMRSPSDSLSLFISTTSKNPPCADRYAAVRVIMNIVCSGQIRWRLICRQYRIYARYAPFLVGYLTSGDLDLWLVELKIGLGNVNTNCVILRFLFLNYLTVREDGQTDIRGRPVMRPMMTAAW